MNSALRNSGHPAAARPNEFGPTKLWAPCGGAAERIRPYETTKPRNRETGGAAMGVRRCEFIRTRPSALRRRSGETHRDAQSPAVETFAQRNSRAVPFGNALDDGEPQTAPAHTRALGSVVGGRRRLAAVEAVEHSRAPGRRDPGA